MSHCLESRWSGGVREGGEQQQRRQSHDMKYWPSCSTTAFGEAKKLRRKSKKIFDKSMKIKENIIKIRENQRQHSQDLNYWPGHVFRQSSFLSVSIFIKKILKHIFHKLEHHHYHHYWPNCSVTATLVHKISALSKLSAWSSIMYVFTRKAIICRGSGKSNGVYFQEIFVFFS